MIRVGTDLYKAVKDVMCRADKLCAEAVACNKFEVTMTHGCDYDSYVSALKSRRSDNDIPLPNLTSGPFQEKFSKTCTSFGKWTVKPCWDLFLSLHFLLNNTAFDCYNLYWCPNYFCQGVLQRLTLGRFSMETTQTISWRMYTSWTQSSTKFWNCRKFVF